LLLVVSLLGCSRKAAPSSVRITNTTQTNVLTLLSPHQNVSGLTLHIHGHIDGTGYVSAANWPTQALTGAVDWRIYHDWFQTNCVIHYQPAEVRNESLIVDYEFH
jgi:hypothetical protein